MRRWLVFFEYALACWVGWLLLVQSVELPELIAGTVAALLAAAVAVGGCDFAGAAGSGPVLSWSRRIPRLPWQIVQGMARVFGTLLHPRRLHLRGVGRMTALPLPDSGTSPLAIARRAIAIWEGSLSPDEYVVCIEREGGRMVVHQLPPKPGVGGGARRADTEGGDKAAQRSATSGDHEHSGERGGEGSGGWGRERGGEGPGGQGRERRGEHTGEGN